MSDRYQSFVSSPVGKQLVKTLGLPNPIRLDRYVAGAPLVSGTVALGGDGRVAKLLPSILDGLAITSVAPDAETASGQKYKGLVFDATTIADSAGLVALQEFFQPLLRSLEKCSRVVVLGTTPETLNGSARVAQRALEGFTRSLAKEVGKGGTVQLVYVSEGAENSIASTLGFLLSPKSAYVSGQVVRIGAHGSQKADKVADSLK